MSRAEPADQRLADYQQLLNRQLGQAQGRIKAVDVGAGLMILAVGAIAYVLSVIMIDQFLALSTGWRIVLLVGFALATFGYLAYAVIIPAMRRVNILYAARAVEQADPSIKNSLINWLLLRAKAEEIPESLFRAIESRAARDISKVNLNDAIQSKRLLHATYVLAGVVVIFCVFSFFTTKELTTSLRRVLFPLAEIAPPTETRLSDIEPGSLEIPSGEKVAISCFAVGKLPESVTAYISSDSGKFWEPNPLEPPAEKHGRWSVTLQDRQKSFEYYLVANDFRSATYRVRVTAAPMITDWKVTYRFPAYTGEPPRTENTGDIDALEGSVAEVEVTTNVPVAEKSGKLELKLSKIESAASMALVEGSDNRLTGKITLAEDGTYRVRFTDILGRSPQFRPVKAIRVRKDLAPQLSFAEPREPEISRPANGSALFRIQASDDYGLRRVRLSMKRPDHDGLLFEREFGKPEEPLGRSQLLVESVQLAPFGLVKGDVIEYWADAQDTKQPAYNVATTRPERRVIVITDPMTESEKQKQDNQEKQGEQGDKQEQKNEEEKGDAEEQKPQENDKQPPDGKQGDGKKSSGKGESKPNDDSSGEQKEKDEQDLEKLKDFFNNRDRADEKKQPPRDKPDQNKADEKPKDQKNDAGQKEDKSDKEEKSPQSKSEQGKGEGKGSSSRGDGKQSEKSSESDKPSNDNSSSSENKSSETDKNQQKKAGQNQPSEKRRDGEKPDNAREDRSSADESKESKEKSEEKKSGADKNQRGEQSTQKKQAGRDQTEEKPSRSESKESVDRERDNGEKTNSERSRESSSEKKSEKKSESRPDRADKSSSESADKGGEEKSRAASEEKTSESDKQEKSKAGDRSEEAREKNDRQGSSESKEGEKKSSTSRSQEASKSTEKKAGQDPSSSGTKKDQAKTDTTKKDEKKSESTQRKDAKKEEASKEENKEKGAENRQAEKKAADGEEKEEKSSRASEKQDRDKQAKQEKSNSGQAPDEKSSTEKSPSEKSEKGRQKSAEKKDGESKESSSQDDPKEKSSAKEKQTPHEKKEKADQGEETKKKSAEGSEEKSDKQDASDSASKQATEKKDAGQPKQSDDKAEKKESSEKASKGNEPSEKKSEKPSSDSSSGSEKSEKQKDAKPGDSPESGNQSEEQKEKKGEPSDRQGKEKPSGESKGGGKDKGDEQPEKGKPQDKPSSDKSGDSKDDKPSREKQGSPPAQKPGNQPPGGEKPKGGPADQNQNVGDPDRGAEDPPKGPISDNTGEKADPNDLKRATDLTLGKLEDQLKNKKVDPELLKKLGWTEADAKKFIDRQRSRQAPAEKAADPLTGKGRGSFGEGTNLRKTVGRSGNSTVQDQLRGLEQGRRSAPPPEYRELYEAYTRGLSSQSTPAEKTSPPPKP